MKILLCFQIFLTPFLLILLGVDFVLVSGQCRSDHQSILIQLKNKLHFSSSTSTKLVSWDPSAADCCTWAGVTCTRNGQVIGLDLSQESITGGIDDSSVLFGLQSLQRLNLAANRFNFTEVSSGFGSLKSLIYLNLSNSEFSGQVPGEVSEMTKLEILDISSLFSYGIRSLRLENPDLSGLVRNLANLQELYLDNVNISAQKSDWGQALSSSLTNLKVLSFSNCQLSGPIHDSLENMQSLSVIRLGQNNLSAPVPDFFANFRNLTVLNLGACNLQGVFPKKVLQLQSLETIDLSVNGNLHGSLPDFPINGSLRSFILSNTNFSGVIPESIANLVNLSRLELPRSNFSGRIPLSIANLTRLSYLDLSSNNFTGQIPSFYRCKNVTHIDFSRNSLSGSIPSAHFQDLRNLVSVDLRFNAFTGSIPSSLFSLPLVQKIQLSNNGFEGSLADVSNATGSLLDTLDLSSNRFEGGIPTSFFELGRLSILLLSSNNLSGAVRAKAFEGLGNLTTLDLSFNNLSIEASGNDDYSMSRLPMFSSLKLASCNLRKFPDLSNQSRLMNLDLSDNKIEGEIPNWIWGVGSGSLLYMNLSFNRLIGFEKPYAIRDVSVLDLHSNRLSGVIPIPPETASYVDFSDNHFGSSIPESIGNSLVFVYFFSVSKNSLTGMIPESICNATYLNVLDLSNNGLSGGIPGCLIEYGGTLGVLNLGNNNLSGRIEGTFQRSCGLNTLDLHGNSLEGEVPPSLANCTMLEVLNLGNNRINDTYPCSLRNNTNLRVLVLRSNRLHGVVRCGPGRYSNWKKLQILDISFNDFMGQVPADRFWHWNAMKIDKDGAEADKLHLNYPFLTLNQFYYQDTVTVTVKGQELELVKILTLFTSIDISNNRFSGEIPREIGQLNGLYLLNVSHNEFTGSIPPSIGNLSQLESLDLSSNKLTGQIPLALATLSFLSVFNSSYNQLEGRIPTGSQFNTFQEDSFEGNKGLCGIPSNTTCIGSTPPESTKSEESENGYDWEFIFIGLGYGAGAAIVLGSIVFCKKGMDVWDKYTSKVLVVICEGLGFRYTSWVLYDEEEDDEKEKLEGDESEFELEDREFKGRYCVYCTKLDFLRKQAVHDAKCTCFDPTPVLSSSSSSFSSEAVSPFSKL